MIAVPLLALACAPAAPPPTPVPGITYDVAKGLEVSGVNLFMKEAEGKDRAWVATSVKHGEATNQWLRVTAQVDDQPAVAGKTNVAPKKAGTVTLATLKSDGLPVRVSIKVESEGPAPTPAPPKPTPPPAKK